MRYSVRECEVGRNIDEFIDYLVLPALHVLLLFSAVNFGGNELRGAEGFRVCSPI